MREKKWLALGLTAVMTAGMMSACGKEAAQETAETKKEETDGNAAAEEGSAAKEKPYDGTELTFWMQSYGNDPSNQTEAETLPMQALPGIQIWADMTSPGFPCWPRAVGR